MKSGPPAPRGKPRQAGPPKRGPRPPQRLDRFKAKAQELHAQGIPFQLAMGVAMGKMELSEALERMANQEKALRIQKEHDISWSLAMQIAVGHVNQEVVLRRRRQEVYVAQNPTRSVLDELFATGDPVRIALFGGDVIEGKIVAMEKYSATISEREGVDPREIHKLQMVYAHNPADWKAVKKAVKVDKKVAAQGLEPAKAPKDRYTVSTKRLFRYLDTGVEVEAKLLSGDKVVGNMAWFSRFELGFATKGGQVVVFRHALQDLASVKA